MLPQDDTPLSVSEVNRRARLALERDLPLLWVAGEVTAFTRAPSGHWYFSLRDAQASLRCAMFRNRNQFMDWQPVNGARVEVRAQPTLYEPRGEFQLTVEIMRRAGLGALHEALARLKAQLEREGLFDPARKRPLPRHPTCIGVVTSPRAAALRDVLITLGRRWPLARVLLYPTPVQGDGAAASIAAALDRAGADGLAQVILLVRGGGSPQDLWSYNEEIVARAIAACPVPTISGVGHETDFTLADFAADLRAPTPTAAAQLATPDQSDLTATIQTLARRLTRQQGHRLARLAQRLDIATARLRHPAEALARQRQDVERLTRRLALAQAAHLRHTSQVIRVLDTRLGAARPRPTPLRLTVDTLERRLIAGIWRLLEQRSTRLADRTAQLGHLNPTAVLARGYSIVRDDAGRVLTDSATAQAGQTLDITLHRGRIGARVEQMHPSADLPRE